MTLTFEEHMRIKIYFLNCLRMDDFNEKIIGKIEFHIQNLLLNKVKWKQFLKSIGLSDKAKTGLLWRHIQRYLDLVNEQTKLMSQKVEVKEDENK